jgi:hypothetical protein
MPRYLIERTYDVTEEELPVVATRSKRIAHEQFPEILWQHSQLERRVGGVHLGDGVPPRAGLGPAARRRRSHRT